MNLFVLLQQVEEFFRGIGHGISFPRKCIQSSFDAFAALSDSLPSTSSWSSRAQCTTVAKDRQGKQARAPRPSVQMFIAMLICCVCSGHANSIVPNASAVQFASDSELQFAKQYHTHQCRFICNDQRNAGLCGLTHISLSEHKTHNISSIHVVHETREPPAAHTLPCSDTCNVFVPWGWVYFAGFLVCIAKHAAAQTVRFCRAIILCILCATRLFEVTVHKQQEHTSIEHEQTRPAPFPESGCSTGRWCSTLAVSDSFSCHGRLSAQMHQECQEQTGPCQASRKVQSQTGKTQLEVLGEP